MPSCTCCNKSSRVITRASTPAVRRRCAACIVVQHQNVVTFESLPNLLKKTLRTLSLSKRQANKQAAVCTYVTAFANQTTAGSSSHTAFSPRRCTYIICTVQVLMVDSQTFVSIASLVVSFASLLVAALALAATWHNNRSQRKIQAVNYSWDVMREWRRCLAADNYIYEVHQFRSRCGSFEAAFGIFSNHVPVGHITGADLKAVEQARFGLGLMWDGIRADFEAGNMPAASLQESALFNKACTYLMETEWLDAANWVRICRMNGQQNRVKDWGDDQVRGAAQPRPGRYSWIQTAAQAAYGSERVTQVDNEANHIRELMQNYPLPPN
jgi:hypothetical protein